MSRATPVYFNQYRNQWAKRRFLLLDTKYDVKRTDSLVNPIVGIVSFTLVIEQTALLPSKEDAERANDFLKSDQPFKVFLTYGYKDDRWLFKGGEYEDPFLRGQRISITPEKVLAHPDSSPEAALAYWLQ